MSGLSFLLPIFRWLPKYSSITSWQNRSVKTYSTPSWSRNLVASTPEWVVICIPSNVCQDRNILLLAFAVKLPGRSRVLCFHSFGHVRNSSSNQSNLWSVVDVYGATKGFLFLDAPVYCVHSSNQRKSPPFHTTWQYLLFQVGWMPWGQLLQMHSVLELPGWHAWLSKRWVWCGQK